MLLCSYFLCISFFCLSVCAAIWRNKGLYIHFWSLFNCSGVQAQLSTRSCVQYLHSFVRPVTVLAYVYVNCQRQRNIATCSVCNSCRSTNVLTFLVYASVKVYTDLHTLLAELWCLIIYATAFPVRGVCVYVLQMFFFVFCCFFVVFCFFPVRQKYETTVLGNGWTDIHETFTKR